MRYVSQTGAGNYTLPSAAHTAAVAGDTILIGPGVFVENSGINVTKRLVWIGAGWDQTTVSLPSESFRFSNATAASSSCEGIKFAASGSGVAFYCTAANCDSITVRRCIFVGGGSYAPILWNQTGARLYLEDCVTLTNYLYANGIEGPRSGGVVRNCVIAANITTGNGSSWAIGSSVALAATLEIYNCIFLNWDDIFNLPSGSPAAIMINNAAYDFTGTTQSWGVIPGSSIVDYNASPATPAAPGTNGLIIASNPFVNYNTTNNYVVGSTDLHLIDGSNLIDGGNPGILDVDNSRSDVGVYGGPRPLIDNGVPNYPWAVNLVSTPNVAGQGTPVNATAIGRVGPQ